VGCVDSVNSEFWGSFLLFLSLIMFIGMPMNFVRSSRFKKMTMGLFGLSAMFWASQPVKALTPSFSANFFKPTVDDSEYFTVYSSTTPKKRYYNFGFWLDYAQHPYEVGDLQFNRTQGLINNLLSGNFAGSYTPVNGVTIGGRLPVYFLSTVRAPLLNRLSENNIDLGDLEIDAKFRLVNRDKHKVGLSLAPFLTVPSATRAVENFSGNGNFTGGMRAIVDVQPNKRVTLALNVGYEAREATTDISNVKIDDHLLLGLGVGVDVVPRKWKIIGEVQAETVVSDFFNRHTTPVEARLGFRYTYHDRLDFNLGGGMGLTNGIASPEFRVLAGVTYAKRSIPSVDLPGRSIGNVDILGRTPGEVYVGEELTLADKIYFEYNQDTIRDISRPTLDKLATFIKEHTEIKTLRVEGHTCDLGGDGYNVRLSDKRARAVVTYLVEQGVDQSVFRSVGYGESKPKVENTDEEHREQNRRVQIFVEEKK